MTRQPIFPSEPGSSLIADKFSQLYLNHSHGSKRGRKAKAL